jgi:hypothetical protein
MIDFARVYDFCQKKQLWTKSTYVQAQSLHNPLGVEISVSYYQNIEWDMGSVEIPGLTDIIFFETSTPYSILIPLWLAVSYVMLLIFLPRTLPYLTPLIYFLIGP